MKVLLGLIVAVLFVVAIIIVHRCLFKNEYNPGLILEIPMFLFVSFVSKLNIGITVMAGIIIIWIIAMAWSITGGFDKFDD